MNFLMRDMQAARMAAGGWRGLKETKEPVSGVYLAGVYFGVVEIGNFGETALATSVIRSCSSVFSPNVTDQQSVPKLRQSNSWTYRRTSRG